VEHRLVKEEALLRLFRKARAANPHLDLAKINVIIREVLCCFFCFLSLIFAHCFVFELECR